MMLVTTDDGDTSNSAHLTRIPLDLTVVWRSKTVTADAPHYPKHLEWRLELTVESRTPARLALFLDGRSTGQWGLVSGPAATDATVTANFFPYDWVGSDDVQINFAGKRLKVNDGSLKRDPRNEVQVVAPSVAETGQMVEIASIQAHGITMSMLAVAELDTERRRLDKWRIKPRFAASLPAHVVALTSGRQSGIIDPRHVLD